MSEPVPVVFCFYSEFQRGLFAAELLIFFKSSFVRIILSFRMKCHTLLHTKYLLVQDK